MDARWPTTSKKRYTELKYNAHIAIMTGKEGEVVSLEGISTISDLISKLDEQYPGIKEVFMPPNDVFNIRTTINLSRLGQRPRNIIDEQEEIKDADILVLW